MLANKQLMTDNSGINVGTPSGQVPTKTTNHLPPTKSTNNLPPTKTTWYDYLKVPDIVWAYLPSINNQKKHVDNTINKITDKVVDKIADKANKLDKLADNFVDTSKIVDSGPNKFISDELVTDVTKNINSGISTLSYLKKSLNDPLSIVMTSMFSVFVYVYFVNELFCQSIGLCYPTYHMYAIIETKNNNTMSTIKLMTKYFLIYSHIEITMTVLKIFGLEFLHAKFLLIVGLVYMTEYQLDWLDNLYNRLIYYDKLFVLIVKKIRAECQKIGPEL